MGNKVYNVEVTLRDGESQERLLKRFLKKCKKQDIIKEYINKTSYFKSKREKRREKQMRNKYLKAKGKL
jgi:ribosomal protein S21